MSQYVKLCHCEYIFAKLNDSNMFNCIIVLKIKFVGRKQMYGSIFNLKVKEGHEQSLIDLFNKYDKPEGGVAWFVMNPDEKKDWIGVAVFEDRESYVKNAENPEQHQRYLTVKTRISECAATTRSPHLESC